MRASLTSSAQQGATLLSFESRTPLTAPGLWFELLLYAPQGSAANCPPQPLELRRPRRPNEAVRRIRVSVRERSASLAPEERRDALLLVNDESAALQALTLVRGGEPVGFSFTRNNGERLEWSVRQVKFLRLEAS